MRILKCEIEIGNYTFDFITDIEVVSSWNILTDTANITIPKKLRYRGPDGKIRKYIVRGTEAVFKRGDTVKITCGYYPSPVFGEVDGYNTIFEGYVAEVSPKRPMTIRCEDAMFNLKKMRIEKYDTKGEAKDLGEVLNDLAVLVNSSGSDVKFDLDIEAEVMNLGEVNIENWTYAQFLEHIKKYGLKSYIRGNTLFVGFARLTQNRGWGGEIPQINHEVMFGRDIISDSSLTYRNADDIDISLTAISIDDNNKRIEAKAGVTYGSSRNLYFYHKLNTDETTSEPIKEIQDSLQKTADDYVNRFKFNGYRGSFTIFGIPVVKHGDAVTIINGDIADTSGTYILEKVVTRFGQGGYRQEIFLSARILPVL